VSVPLYTRDFATACVIHLAGALSLTMWFLLPLYLARIGASEATIGALIGLATAASVAVRPLVGVLLDRVGPRRVLLAGGVLNGLSWLPFIGIGAVGPWLFLWTVLHAIVGGGLFTSYFTYAARLSPPSRRAEGIAVFGVAGMAANGIGPFVGEIILERAGAPGFFGTAAVLAFVATAITLLVPPTAGEPVAHDGSWAAGLRTALRHPGLGRVLVATVVLGLGINAAYFFVAPWVHGLGLARAGPFFAAYSATSVVIRLFGRRTLDDLGAHRVSVPAFAVFAAGLIGLAFLPAAGLMVACGIACGAGHGTLFPVLNALATHRVPAGMQGTAVSLQTAAVDLGAVVGTPICGALAEVAGYPAMFWTMALACVAGSWLVWSDPVRDRAVLAA
jgi:MFS family permease